jgi:hypothetical protein
VHGVLQDLAALAPPLIMCVAFIMGVGWFLRREMAPRRRAARDHAGADSGAAASDAGSSGAGSSSDDAGPDPVTGAPAVDA